MRTQQFANMFKTGAAITAVLAMTACGATGGDDTASDHTGGVEDDGVVTLTMSDDQNGAYATMAKEYEKATGVKVNVMEVPYDDLNTKIANAGKADDLPDVARVPQVNPVWTDELIDLSDLATSHKAMDSLITKTSDGKVLTIPSDLTAVGLMLNTSLFDKAGVSYPKTSDESWIWDEFIDAVTKVQAATGAKYGMVMDASSHRERSFMYQFGSKGVQKQSDGTYKLDAGAKTALEFLKKIDDDKIMPKSVWASNDDPSALFKSGQVAAYYSGNWQISDFINSITSFEWKTVPMPSQPTRATNIGTNYMVSFSNEGKKFLDWFYSTENYTKFCEIGSYLPALEDIEPNYSDRLDDFRMYQDEIAKADQSVSAHQITTQLELALQGAVLGEDPMKSETVKYLTGEQDVDTAIANMEKRFTESYALDE